MKRSKLLGGGQSSPAQPAPAATTVNYHDYLEMKVMASLTNVEISIEDSEVSVGRCNLGYYV